MRQPQVTTVPPIVYGTAWKKNETERFVIAALRAGFRGIDTAGQPKHYNEAGVGAGIAACLTAGLLGRGELFLQTKYSPFDGDDRSEVPYDPAATLREQVAQSFERSLQNLQTTYVDSLLLHSPFDTLEDTLEAWRGLEDIVKAGGTRLIGISNCYDLSELEDLHRAAEVKPTVLQNRFYAETDYDREIRAFCREHGIVYQSFWTLTANPHLLTHRMVRALASKYGRTAAQILFRYLTLQDVVPLTGTTSATHMQQDLAIFEFELTATELEEITQLIDG
jgi:diketogulonate reductase-like aldo/keto reductase